MMHSSFWFGAELKDFLFSGLNISSNWGLVLLCGILVVSVWLQQALRLVLAYTKHSVPRHACQDHTNLLGTPNRTPRWREVAAEGSLYVLEVIVAYLLMLTVMTFNAWILLAVLTGYAASYLTLGHRLSALSHRPLLPCSHCTTRKVNMGSSSSVAISSTTPPASQVDLTAVTAKPSAPSCCDTTASVHL